MNICVYGASSQKIDKSYIEQVELFGKELAARGNSLVFGAGKNGLMGAAARGVRSENGNIIGVIPHFFKENMIEEIYTECDKIIFTDTMRERKQKMEDLADAFIIVPGGIGTFEEFFEILTLKQLSRHSKAIAIYNINGYYDALENMMKTAVDGKFLNGECMSLYVVKNSIDDVFSYIESYTAQRYENLKDG